MIKLPDVTLVCVDCINYVGAINAIKHSIKGIEFGEVLFISDRKITSENFKSILIDSINSKVEYSYFMINELTKYINTSHCLVIQYDGYVIRPDLWDNDFLSYDYIGAPWWYPVNNVGNGGFSLRSKHLLKSTAQQDFIKYHPEDDMICRENRQLLESKYRINYAPVDVATKFSYEPNNKREPFTNHTFGFHGVPSLIL